ERASDLGDGALSTADQATYARALLQLGRPHDALDYTKTAMIDPDPEVRVQAQLLAGRAHRVLGDSEQAVRLWTAALATAEVADLPEKKAKALLRLGMADYLEGRIAAAADRFAAAYQVSVEAGASANQAWALQHLGWVNTTRGDFATADALLTRSARLFAELDDPVGRAWIRGTTAFARLLGGRLTEARKLAMTFLPFGERIGEHWAVGTLRSVGAFAACELGDVAEADREAGRAFREFADFDDDWGRGLALVVRGLVARNLAQLPHALDILAEAKVFSTRSGHPLLIGMARTARGFVHLELGDFMAAEEDASETLALMPTYDARDAARVGPSVLLAMARHAQGDLGMALGSLAEVAAHRDGPSLLLSRARAVACYAELLLADGQVEEALAQARWAAAHPSEDLRTRIYIVRVLAVALEASGAREEARKAAQSAVELAYSSEQVADRAASDILLASLSG
ncbi:MAG: adenylate/guanylate cyclase domain-containing protein, partial [Longispora sp.]|nr:adenylate/guanylate cyclase domain-containing protein [Longispora sp. (in: high G+C Gram-positive bacteria)]